MNIVILHFVLLAVFVFSISCLTEDERIAVKQDLQPLVKTCLAQCNLEHVEYVKGDIDPCLKKCFVKTLKVFDDKGQLDRKVEHELFEKYIENKAEALKMEKAFEECYDEGDSSVTEDSETESKRIELVFECLKIVS